jgi:hypothetical protein
MIRYVLQFCFCSPDKLSGTQEKEWDKEWNGALKPLTFWSNGLGDYKVDLTSPRGQEFFEFLQRARKAGARINGIGLEEELFDDEQHVVEWFELDPDYSGSEYFGGMDENEYLRLKPDRIKPGTHVVGYRDRPYVSERFKAVVERHRLKGIEFIWVRDIGKYKAPQWYLPVCLRALGRGVDPPWMDITKLSGRGFQVLEPTGRHGQSGTPIGQSLNLGAVTDALRKKLLPVAVSMELLNRHPYSTFVRRYLRDYLPDTDFAYTMWDTCNSPGEVVRMRGLAMNRKARDLLRANGIITDAQCKGVLILDEPPQGVENLDEKYGPAEPAFTAEQMAQLRELEAKAWAEHIAHPKPPRAPDLKRSLSLLRARKRQAPKDFAKPASAKMIEEAAKTSGREIPAAWQQVLRISNGGRIDKSPLAAGCACKIMPLKDLPQWQRSEAKYYRGGGADLPDSMLFIIHTEIGDSIWLDTAKQKPDGDCRVVLMSHETWSEERDWPTVAEFLEELLTETQEEEG